MKYTGPQNVESLMQTYDSEYNAGKPNAKPTPSLKDRTIDADTREPRIELIQQMFIDETITTKEYIDKIDLSQPEYITFTTDKSTGKTRIIEYTLGDVDAKYPRNQWIQMLLNKGVRIENYKDYEEYLDIRTSMFPKEYLALDDADSFDQADYIDKNIQEYQRIQEARKSNPDVKDWIVIGENALPSIPGRMYVCKTESGFKIRSKKTSNGEPKLSDQQKTDLQNKGIEPEGWEVVYTDEKGNIL